MTPPHPLGAPPEDPELLGCRGGQCFASTPTLPADCQGLVAGGLGNGSPCQRGSGGPLGLPKAGGGQKGAQGPPSHPGLPVGSACVDLLKATQSHLKGRRLANKSNKIINKNLLPHPQLTLSLSPQVSFRQPFGTHPEAFESGKGLQRPSGLASKPGWQGQQVAVETKASLLALPLPNGRAAAQLGRGAQLPFP